MSKNNEPFQLSVNEGQYEFSISPDEARSLDLISTGDERHFHLLKDGKSYHAELVEADFSTKTYTIRVNGSTFKIHIADQYERLVKQLGLTVGGVQKMNAVKAPMPGLVFKIVVEAGQTVEKGDALVILEAMKMENVLKATGDGRVKSIAVAQGQAVEKGQLLLEME